MTPMWSAIVGFCGGLVIAIISKAIDWWRQARNRELDVAMIVGEMRSSLSSVLIRLDRIELRMRTMARCDHCPGAGASDAPEICANG